MVKCKGWFMGLSAVLLAWVVIPSALLAMKPFVETNEEPADFVARRIIEAFSVEMGKRNVESVQFACRRFNGEAHVMNLAFCKKLTAQLRKTMPRTQVVPNAPSLIITRFFRDFSDARRSRIVQVHAELVVDGEPVAKKMLDDPALGQLKDYIFVSQYGADKGDALPPRTVAALNVHANSNAKEPVDDFRAHAANQQVPVEFVAAKIPDRNSKPAQTVIVQRNGKPYFELSMFTKPNQEGSMAGAWNQVEFPDVASADRGNVRIDPDNEYKLKVRNLSQYAIGFRVDIDGLGWEQFRDKGFLPGEKVIMICEPGESHEFEGWLKNGESKWPFRTELPGEFGLRKSLTDIGRIQIQAVWGCEPGKVPMMEKNEGAYFAQSKGGRNLIQTAIPKQGDREIARKTVADTRNRVWESLKESDARSLCWFHLVP